MLHQRQLAAIAEIDGLFRDADVAYWLFGGWAVDFHAGHITRAHSDIDIAVWAADQERIARILDANAWSHAADPDADGFTCYTRDGIMLEVAFLARDCDGSIYTPTQHGRGEWPEGTFGDDVLELLNVSARVVGLRALIADKSVTRADPLTAAKDRADISSLTSALPELVSANSAARQWTPYAELNDVLSSLATRVSDALGENLVGVYVQGSFAVGDYDEHSDVDFVIVTRDALTPDDVDALQHVHRFIYNLDSGWAKHLEGSYFTRALLSKAPRRDELLWYLDHGASALVLSGHCNTLVVRSVLRDHGVAVVGPPAVKLVAPVSVDALRAEMRAVILEWGEDILRNPAPYANRFYQSFIVLSYCRMLHDYHAGSVGSKRAGAAWATATLDARWRGLINRAWEGRPDPATSVRQPADHDDFADTLAFVQYCMDHVK